MKFLVKETANWADEFDIEGFKIMEANNKEELEEKIINNKVFPCELYFGTNEWQDYNSKEQLLRDLEICEISDIEIKVFEKFFGKLDRAFGVTSII